MAVADFLSRNGGGGGGGYVERGAWESDTR